MVHNYFLIWIEKSTAITQMNNTMFFFPWSVMITRLSLLFKKPTHFHSYSVEHFRNQDKSEDLGQEWYNPLGITECQKKSWHQMALWRRWTGLGPSGTRTVSMTCFNPTSFSKKVCGHDQMPFCTKSASLKQKLKERIFTKFSLFFSHHYLLMKN